MASIDLHVDLDALTHVQQEIATLLTALTDLGGSRAVQADGTSMGSRDVADAVHRFVSGWTDGRERIIENLRSCQRMAAEAVTEYAQTEAALAQGTVPVIAPRTDGSA